MSNETLFNLEAAAGGESFAHVKYRYFAKIARNEGLLDIAKHFEHTAEQELVHAFGHLELLLGKDISTQECLEKAIEGETYEFEIMYPGFKEKAELEGQLAVAAEAQHQIQESKEHAKAFAEVLKKAEKRFAALAKIEKRHSEAYQRKLDELLQAEPR